MAGRNHFVMETKGHCLFCLKLSQRSSNKSKMKGYVLVEEKKYCTVWTRITPGGKGTMGAEGEDDDSVVMSGKLFSLQRLCHYLRLDMRRVFQDVVAIAPPSTFPVLERSELKGVLCEECGGLVETMSEVTLELEILQMKLDSVLRSVRDKVSDSEDGGGDGRGRRELMEKFKKEMLATPQTLLHYGIVEHLRKETYDKSSFLLENVQPRVMLKRFDDEMDLGKPKTASPPQPSPPHPPVEGVNEEVTQLCESESVPVISSVQGSYTGNVDHQSKLVHQSTANLVAHDSPRGSPGPPPLQVEVEFEALYNGEGKTESEDPLWPDNDGLAPPTLFPFTSLPEQRSSLPIPAPVFKELRLDCTICHKMFKNNRLRLIHEMGVHKKVEKGVRFQCSLCPASYASYSSRSALQQHRRRYHKAHGQRQTPNYHSWIKSETGSRPRTNFVNAGEENVEAEVELSVEAEDSSPQPELDIEKMNQQLADVLSMSSFGTGDDGETMGTTEHDIDNGQGQDGSANHSGNGKTCQFCHKHFPRELLRLDHEKTVHFGMRFQCRLCSAKFLYRGSLQRHRKQAHNQTAAVYGSKTVQDRKQDSPTPINGNMDEDIEAPANLEMVEDEEDMGRPPDPLATEMNTGGLLTSPLLPAGEQNTFPCHLCPAVFRLKNSLSMHRYRNHGRQRLQKKTKKRSDFHLEHETEDPLSTPTIPLLPSPSPSLSRQRPSKLGIRKPSLNCTICHKAFRRNCERLDHEKTAHYGMRFRCGICPSTFTSRSSMNLHRRRIHKRAGKIGRANKKPVPMTAPKIKIPAGSLELEPDYPAKKFQCRICHKRFLRSLLLSDHEKIVHQNMRLHCDYCSSTFLFRTSLSRHLKQIHNQVGAAKAEPKSSTPQSGTSSATQKPHKVQQQSSNHACTICHKVFKSNKILLWHVTKLHQVRMYPCGFCPKEFTDPSNMRRHKRRCHTGSNATTTKKVKVKSKQRQLPHNTFQIGIGNIERIEISKGTGPLPDFLPEVEDELESQELLSHPEVIGVVEVEHKSPSSSININTSKPFKCQYCDKRFRIIKSLRQHRTIAHLGPMAERKFECKMCNKRFILNSHLRRHHRTIHAQA